GAGVDNWLSIRWKTCSAKGAAFLAEAEQQGNTMGKLEKQSASPPPGQIKHDDHSIGTLDASSFNPHGPGTADDEMFFGDGNRPTNYNISVDSKTHIELGLKIHYRTGDDIIPTSVDSDGTA